MSKFEQVAHFFVSRFPGMGVVKLTRGMYLTDWRAAILLHNTITGMQWKLGEYGPEARELFSFLKTTAILRVEADKEGYTQLNIADSHEYDFSKSEIDILEFVVNTLNEKQGNDLIRLINSTFPVIATNIGAEMNMTQLASEYERVKTEMR
jgi:hypothetical protein